MKTYRNPRWSLVTQAFLITLMALIGVSIAIHPGNAGHPGTAPGYIAFGSILAALFILMLAGQLTSRLVVTEQGLTWRYMTRTRSIAWAEIQDVLVVPASGLSPWYSPSIKVNDRLIRINSVIGPTPLYREHRYGNPRSVVCREPTRPDSRPAHWLKPPKPPAWRHNHDQLRLSGIEY